MRFGPMENIYSQYIQIWLYIYALLTEHKKEQTMADRSESFSEWVGLDLTELSGDDKMNLIEEIADTLTAQQLLKMREVFEAKRLEKLEDAKEQVFARMRAEFEQLGINFDEIMGAGRRKRVTLPPKYRDPITGRTWTGRGQMPKWLREVEQGGGNIESFIVTEEALKPGDINL